MKAAATSTGYLPGTAWDWRHFLAVFFAGRVLRILAAQDTSPEDLGYLIGGKEIPA